MRLYAKTVPWIDIPIATKLVVGTWWTHGLSERQHPSTVEALAGPIAPMAMCSRGGDGEATHNPFIGHDPVEGLRDMTRSFKAAGWLG